MKFIGDLVSERTLGRSTQGIDYIGAIKRQMKT